MVLESDIGRQCLICEDRCGGFQKQKFRKVCRTCNCTVDKHDVADTSYRNLISELDMTNHKQTVQYNASIQMAQRLGYTWLPIGLEAYEVEQFAACVPPDLVSRVPTSSSNLKPTTVPITEQSRADRFRWQIPPHDRGPSQLNYLDGDEELQAAKAFLRQRSDSGVQFGWVTRVDEHDGVICLDCTEGIGFGDFCVRVSPSTPGGKGDESIPTPVWHPTCFKCQDCRQVMVDYLYGQHADKFYCQRHYLQMLRPRCFACDELIFGFEYTKAMEQEHHQGHFTCKQCEKALAGQRYILKEEQPYCLQCYEQVFANTCEECKEKIGCDSKDMSFKERHWHEKCFNCSDCQASLVDKPFATKEDKLFCSDCYDNKFAARCDACSNVFKAGMRKYEYRGKQWHEECFTCLECKQPIGAKSFIPRDQNVVCVPCYEEKYAQRCNKCTQVIRRGGVTYKGEPWHKECFTCTNCEKQLAGIKFTSKDDKPYCSECYGELFAKKCCKCAKPITGFGGCKFISFEERHWHSECFCCSKCDTNLVGKGFLTSEDRIICPECGR